MSKTTLNLSVKNSAGITVKPHIIVGDGGSYSSGDMLDANAVEALINSKIAGVVGGATTSSDTLKEIEDKIDALAMSQITNDAGYVQQDQNGQLKINETNITIVSNQPFPASWPTGSDKTFSDLVTAIDNDAEAVKGKVYLSTVHYSDLPANMGDAEVKVEIMDSSHAHKIAVLSITSANVSPYNWHATIWSGDITDWHSYALAEEEPLS